MTMKREAKYFSHTTVDCHRINDISLTFQNIELFITNALTASNLTLEKRVLGSPKNICHYTFEIFPEEEYVSVGWIPFTRVGKRCQQRRNRIAHPSKYRFFTQKADCLAASPYRERSPPFRETLNRNATSSAGRVMTL
jgi:hypothetical protein